jgi:hypothetical protein
MKLYLPMTPGGGAFLACVGAAILSTTLTPSSLSGPALVAGFAIGILALIATSIAGRLRGLPKPTTRQLVLVWIPVAAEMLLFFLLLPRLPLDERTSMVAIIAVVGAHFLPMVWSFGPLIVWLGLACMAVAAAGLLIPQIPSVALVVADGVLKLVFGLAMFAALLRVPPCVPSPSV